jgi:hypothetical protein
MARREIAVLFCVRVEFVEERRVFSCAVSKSRSSSSVVSVALAFVLQIGPSLRLRLFLFVLCNDALNRKVPFQL